MTGANWKRYPGDRSYAADHHLMAEPEEECFDCHHVFSEHEEQFEDTMKNPMCWPCREKLIEKAEAIRDQMREEEALNREMCGRKRDRKDADRINGRY